MGPIDFFVFITIFLVLGILLYIPVRWLIRRKTQKINSESTYALHITSSGLALFTFMVSALVLGFVQEGISPETFFSRFISSWQGKLYYVVVIFLFTILLAFILQMLGFTLFKHSDKEK